MIDYKGNRLKTFQYLLKEYEKALEEKTIDDYKIPYYEKNIDWFREEISELEEEISQGALSKEL